MRTAVERAEARRAAKAAKREANKASWATHPANANAAWLAKNEAASQPSDIRVEPDNTPQKGNRSLQKLRQIMAGVDLPLSQRVDAAASVLGYEHAAASLSGRKAEQVVAASSYRFLQQVADDADTPTVLRLKALKEMAAVESAKAAKAPSPSQIAEEHAQGVSIFNARRRMLLHELGITAPDNGHAARLDAAISWAPSEPIPEDIGNMPDNAYGSILDAYAAQWAAMSPEDRAAYDARKRQRIIDTVITSRPDPFPALVQSAGKPAKQPKRPQP